MKVYFVAGEPSGDLLASGLMNALLKTEPGVQFRGVGGESMAACSGMQSLFDIAEISVMGIFEVLPRLPLILKRISQTADDIQRWSPDVIVTVDSWGFVSSLLGKLRKRGVKIPMVHYVAPQVWAWKKGRAKNVARLVDRLMMLLPDEGRYFEKFGLQCDFVGHPVIERMSSVVYDTEGFRQRNDIPADARVICVLPGSRRSETGKLIPVFRDALERIRKAYGDFYVVIPTVAGVEARVREAFAESPYPVRVVTGSENRYNAFKTSRIALAASGTVSLELAAVGTPHLIAYKFNALSNLAARLLVRIRFANLLNLLADREIIPEFVLHNCKPEPIAACALELLGNPDAAAAHVTEARQILQRLRLPDILPSDRAAQIVRETAQAGWRPKAAR